MGNSIKIPTQKDLEVLRLMSYGIDTTNDRFEDAIILFMQNIDNFAIENVKKALKLLKSHFASNTEQILDEYADIVISYLKALIFHNDLDIYDEARQLFKLIVIRYPEIAHRIRDDEELSHRILSCNHHIF
jgi:hypothetical protein